MKFKIFLTLGFAFCITLGMLFSLMDLYINIYDPEWNGVFSNEKIKNNEKRIFLIGASNVYSIDVDRISEKIRLSNAIFLSFLGTYFLLTNCLKKKNLMKKK